MSREASVGKLTVEEVTEADGGKEKPVDCGDLREITEVETPIIGADVPMTVLVGGGRWTLLLDQRQGAVDRTLGKSGVHRYSRSTAQRPYSGLPRAERKVLAGRVAALTTAKATAEASAAETPGLEISVSAVPSVEALTDGDRLSDEDSLPWVWGRTAPPWKPIGWFMWIAESVFDRDSYWLNALHSSPYDHLIRQVTASDSGVCCRSCNVFHSYHV